MEQYQVTGMSCAACSARVEKAVRGVSGVTDCSVSLLTEQMSVTGDAAAQDVIAAVEKAGYHAALRQSGGGARPSAETAQAQASEAKPADHTQAPRLIASLILLALLMYISMGYTMLSLPLPEYLQSPMAAGLLQLLLSTCILALNQKFFISGTKGLLHRAPNMDTLVALGSGASYLYSVCALFGIANAQANGHTEHALHLLHGLYFESAAMILALIAVGKLLETRAKGRTTDALKSLLRLAPKTATLLRDGEEHIVPVETVHAGDIFLVRPGETIPVDGVVIEGSSAVNEAAMTGESVPVEKKEEDTVTSATLNQSGFLRCRATRVGEDTTLSQIIRLVSDAAATKAPIAKIADKVSGVFVPIVLLIAAVTTLVWLLVGDELGAALTKGVSVLVISCPCALGLATPVAIMVGSGVGAKRGILYKTAASLEAAGRTQIVVLDKTGTVTTGAPTVTDLLPAEGVSEADLLQTAYALEQKSEHPFARAILGEARARGLKAAAVTNFQALPGNGLTARLDGAQLTGGSLSFLTRVLTEQGTSAPHSETAVPTALHDAAERFAQDGKTPLLFAKDGKLLGIIAVADVIKEDSSLAIARLRQMGLRVVMLTGDNPITAAAIAKQAGIDEVRAGVLPDGKAAVVREFMQLGKTAMVGDGINDAPALTAADTGIAIGAGTDVAIDAADIVLMKSRLSDVPTAILLSRAVLKNIHENLFWAFIYNVIGIPLAAGVWIPVFGWSLNPMFGAAAMSLSSFCVVSNALRLNRFSPDKLLSRHKRQGGTREVVPATHTSSIAADAPYTSSKATEAQQAHSSPATAGNTTQAQEVTIMQKTMKIEGMMCGHCEGTVKKTLEAIPHVTAAEVSHTAGTAIVTLDVAVADDSLTAAITEAGYTVTSITAAE